MRCHEPEIHTFSPFVGSPAVVLFMLKATDIVVKNFLKNASKHLKNILLHIHLSDLLSIMSQLSKYDFSVITSAVCGGYSQ